MESGSDSDTAELSSPDDNDDRDKKNRRGSVKGGQQFYVQPHRRSSEPEIDISNMPLVSKPLKSILKKSKFGISIDQPSQKEHKEIASLVQGNKIGLLIIDYIPLFIFYELFFFIILQNLHASFGKIGN